MRSILVLTSLLAVFVAPRASHAQNDVLFDPGEVRFASRGDLGASAGEMLQGFHASHWRGLGGVGNFGQIAGFRASSLQDADRRTAETFRWVVRTGSDAAGPAPTAANELFVSGLQTLGPVLGGGSIAWDVTSTLRTPIRIPGATFFAVGIRVPANAKAKYQTDGLSVWIGANLSGKDDNMASRFAVDQAWQIVGDRVTHPSGKRVWRLGFQTAGPSLQFGNMVGTTKWPVRFGSGGLFPAPTQGLAYRVRASGRDGQIALMLLSTSDFNGFALSIFGSRFWLEWNGLYPGIFHASLVHNGVAVGVLAPSLPFGLPKHLTWQAVVVHPTTLDAQFTNAIKSSH